ncbi:carbohydrate ABC transporter permease [Saccharomonospora sp. NPDC046836]|uniref:carbohydrate ABC transporter permease n=1 Tax=Saccharomonospora sp. NPDC046836 TaxID=3156921 RepID=UPI0033F67654
MTAVLSSTTAPEPVEDQLSGPPRRSVASRILGWLGSRLLRVILLVIALFWLMPVLGLLVSSLRDETDNRGSGWWTIFTAPAQLTLDNYRDILGNETILRSLWNTVLISVPATLLVVVISALAAYALAWLNFRGRDWLMIGVVAMLVMPIQVALIPIARLYGELDMFGSLLGVVLFHVALGLPFGVFLLRNFFLGIPKDLLEAARMDGATEWSIFRRVILPVGLPAIASLAIFQFLWVWNDMLVALVFASSDSQPITLALQSQLRQFGANMDLLATGSFVSMIIPLIVFFSCQRYFTQGVLAGSTK